MTEKFIEYLEEAKKIIRTVDHLVYITFPLIKDKKIILKIISETQKAIAYCINSILQYEYLYKRIKLYRDAKSNFQTFIDKSSKRYDITPKEIKAILNLFEIAEAHKASPFEFIKNDKIVILSENMRQEILDIEKIKEFLTLAKSILLKTKNRILQ